jgi:NAD(P)-dependent dehydrogenase (short-subunit alcohol dehydrogenase family)
MGQALAGRTALVIGGSSGIGLGTARLLARDGARVTIAGRTAEKLRAAAAELADDGLDVAWLVCDALDGASVRAAVAAAGQAAGEAGRVRPGGEKEDAGRDGVDGDAAGEEQVTLDIAVVVPGGGTIGPVLLYGDDEFGEQVNLNVRPVYLALKYAGQAMVRAGGGSFVAISSTAAALSSRYLAAYCAGKAAVDQLVRVAADELGPLGVRVNSVRPGMTRTAATERALSNAAMAGRFIAQQPIPRHGEVPDIAAAIRYLAGPESSWVTGQHITVDGGHTLRAFIDYEGLIPLPDQAAVARGQNGRPATPD